MSKAPASRPSVARGRGRAPFEVDRVILLRVAFVAVALLFLYLIAKVSIIAFGSGSAREARRIEHAVDPAAVAKPVKQATPSPSESASR